MGFRGLFKRHEELQPDPSPELALGPFCPPSGATRGANLTRDDWVEAARYLLEGAFSHLKDPAKPLVFPRREVEVSYPHANATKRERDAERFEGLARTFLLAAPLIHEDPGATANGICLRAYYRDHILRACSPGDPLCVGSYHDLMAAEGNPHAVFQQTVECGLLAVGLWLSWDEVWLDYTPSEQAIIRDFVRGYALGNTVHQNWRLFNLLMFAFLHMAGEDVDEGLMADLASAVARDHVGGGWFRDGQSFDFYSAWSYATFAGLWCVWYGRDHLPGIARTLEHSVHELARTLPVLLDREGRMPMWGRSSAYRFAVTSALVADQLLGQAAVDPGLARRLCSGCLMQFLGRNDFLRDGIPSLGFYGQFTPAVQGYSCAASPYWMGLAFMCLRLPADHRLWAAGEPEDPWADMPPHGVRRTVLDGPGICATNHAATGATILRTGKVVLPKGDDRSANGYLALAYHTTYPWEAPPTPDVIPQGYLAHDRESGERLRANVMLWHGLEGDVLHRRALLGWEQGREAHWTCALDLADVEVPLGILRVDLPQLLDRPYTLTLGSYGFPDNGTAVERRQHDGAQAIVLSGRDSTGAPRAMAMTVWGCWEQLDIVAGRGTNPDSPASLTIVARLNASAEQAGRLGPLVSQVITREDGLPFTDDDLFPIARMDRIGEGRCAPVRLVLKDGRDLSFDHGAAGASLQV